MVNGKNRCVMPDVADLDDHLRSDNFSVLRGAVRVLNAYTEMRFHAVSQTGGEKAIKRAREQRD